MTEQSKEAREGEAVAWRYRSGAAEEHWKFSASKVYADPSWGIEQQPLYTHPAAPSADKLRIATDAFDAIIDLGRALRSGGPDSSDLNDLSDNLDSAVNIASEALAVLKAEG